jgi:hypothetical protein
LRQLLQQQGAGQGGAAALHSFSVNLKGLQGIRWNF